MSPARRRPRRRPGDQASASPPQPRVPGRALGPRPLPEWRWRTFPVYFAFAIGLFVGTYLGAVGIALDASGNGMFFLTVAIGASILLGFGLSRLVVRSAMQRRWIRPRPARKP